MLPRAAALLAVACAALAAASSKDASPHGDRPDCPVAGDGYYVRGCSSRFWRCVNDRLYTYECPKGLFFNPQIRKCNYKAEVPLCSVAQDTASGNIIKAAADFNCTGLADGPYRPNDVPCSNTFITCFSGNSAEQACPYKQFYNEGKKRCDHRETIPACVEEDASTHGHKSKIGGSITTSCPALRSGHVDIPCAANEICQKISAPVDGQYLCETPFAVWYGPLGTDTADEWTLAEEGLHCSSDGHWYDGNDKVTTAAVDCTADKSAFNAQGFAKKQGNTQRDQDFGAKTNSCPGLFTGDESAGIPCNDDETCQAIARPRNGKYSCDAPFALWYGPIGLKTADRWTQAKDGLVCGTDGMWYDNGKKVTVAALDCTAPKATFAPKETVVGDSDCAELYSGPKGIPCDHATESCKEAPKPVNGRYTCETPFALWYGPKNSKSTKEWTKAVGDLVCKDGVWFDGENKISAAAVDCTANKVDCANLPDGSYNGKAASCSAHFWQCFGGEANLLPCPQGTFFDEFTKQCDYKEVIESCGGKHREIVSTTQPSTIEEAVAHKDVPVGGCSPLNSNRAEIACPDGFACTEIHEPVNGKYICEAPYTLSYGPKGLLNGEQWREADHGLHCNDGTWYNGEMAVHGDAVQCTTKKFDCVGKVDSSYVAHEEECSSYFWNCAHSDAFLYRCPRGLFFDKDTMACDYKETITACGGRKADATTASPSADVPSDASTTENPSSLFDCSSRDDGYHESGPCQRRFWHCAAKKTFAMDCPDGLVYDAAKAICQYPVACGAALPSTTAAPTQEPSKMLDHGEGQVKLKLPTTSFDCSGQSDGLYVEAKCQKTYVQCTNGRAFTKECPAGLVYNEAIIGCDYLDVCMRPPATTTAAPTETTAVPTRRGPAPPAADSPTSSSVIPASIFDCSGQADGLYTNGKCQKTYIQCTNGRAYSKKCPAGLVYNDATISCDYLDVCMRPPTMTTPTPMEANVVPTRRGPAPPAADYPTSSSALPTSSFDCSREADGLYTYGKCQKTYIQCTNGRAFDKECPAGLVYNEDTISCDYLDVCMRPPSTTTPAAIENKPTRMGPVAPAVSAPKAISCINIEDGPHALSRCGSDFFLCWKGTGVASKCNDGLFFNAATGQCDYKANILECGGVAPPAKDVVVPSPPSPPPRPQPVAAESNFCVGKDDGVFAAGCQMYFYLCQSGVTSKMDCPVGLFYDDNAKACDHREIIPACGGRKATTAASLDAPATAAPTRAPKIDLFCGTKADGFYGFGCKNHWRSCIAGKTYMMNCPSGLFYDVSRQLCDQKALIPTCGGTRTTAAPASDAAGAYGTRTRTAFRDIAPVTAVPTAKPVVVADRFCASQNDGFYGDGCASYFYSCQSGTTYKMTCPAGLFYDVDALLCDTRDAIVACGGHHRATVAPALDVPPPVVTPVDPFCKGKVDGFYGLGCRAFFYSCQSGVTFKMTCPAGLYYDVDAKSCDHKVAIAVCGGAKETVAPVSRDVPTTVAPSTPAPISVDSYCVGKDDGFYGNGCQQYFYTCQDGRTFKMTCPTGLYYDVDAKSCDHKDAITACGGVRPTPGLVRDVVPVAATTQAPLTFCVGKADGFYNDGCSAHFYTCGGEVTYKFSCPPNLFYDIVESKCDFRDNIAACGAKPTSAPSVPLPAPAAAPSSDQYSRPLPRDVPATPAPVVPTIAPTTFCSGKPDGYYGDGCQPYVFYCSGSTSYKIACPVGLFYNVDMKMCDRKELIVECGGRAPTATTVIVRDAVSAAPAIVDSFCNGKTDGFYAPFGCQPYFNSCQNGNAYKMDCPSGLIYDDERKACDRKEEIPACGGRPARDPVVTSGPYIQPTAAPIRDAVTRTTMAAASTACQGKADGFYGPQGCQPYFYACQNGNINKMNCPVGLYYDTERKACDNKNEIVACEGSHPSPALSPVEPTIVTAAPITRPVDRFCIDKADGMYGAGCQAYFYNCQGRGTIKMACPAGLFFDVSSKRCDARENIVSCGGARPTAAPVAQAPPATYGGYPTKNTVRDVAPVTAVTAVPVIPSKNSCAGRMDGYYGEGCAGYFIQCSNGIMYKSACPSGLFYDESTSACDVRDSIVACGGAKPTAFAATAAPALAPIDGQNYGGYPTKNTVRDIAAVTAAPVIPTKNSCKGKMDGFYGEGCAGYFIQCSNGVAYKSACPSGLFYDDSTNTCDTRNSIVSCGGVKPTAFATTVSPALAPAAPTDNFCAGKKDGFFSDGCAGYFYSCYGGLPNKMLCPSGLIYDDAQRQCLRKEEVAACGGAPAQAPAVLPATASPATVAPAYAPSNNFCQGKTDGYYAASKCGNSFNSCYGGYTKTMLCPTGLIYDDAKKQCLRKEEVVACGGSPAQSPAVLPATAAPAPIAPIHVPVDPFCQGKTDGFYAPEGCAIYFYSCTSGQTHKMDCPAGLSYDASARQCDRRESIAACGGTVPAAAPPAPPPRPVVVPQPVAPQPAVPHPAAPKPVAPQTSYPAPAVPQTPVDSYARITPRPTYTAAPVVAASMPPAPTPNNFVFSCAGKTDAFYAAPGCADHFFSCVGGQAYKISCPIGLFYDDGESTCTYRDQIVACGGARLPSTTPAPVPRDFVTAAPSTACNGKDDGVYAIGECSAEYLACHSGLASRMACQPTLFFNAANLMCDYRDNVPACAASRDVLPTRPSILAGATLSPYLTVATPPTPTKRPALSPSGNQCANLVDGYYATGCSATYTACMGGATAKMTCPEGLKYSSATGSCDYDSNVAECGGVPPPASDAVTSAPLPPIQPVAPISAVIPPRKPLVLPATPAPSVAHPQCAGRPNGIYAMGTCTQNYIACVGEKATIGLCREDLFYDEATGMCNWKEKVLACGAPAPTQAPIVIRDVTRATLPTSRPLAPQGVNIDCTNLADGTYAVAHCTPHWHKCKDRRHFSRGTCAAGQLFNAHTGGCVDQLSLPACSKATTPSPMVPMVTPGLAPIQPVQSQQPQYGVQQSPSSGAYARAPPAAYAPSYSAPAPAFGVAADPRQFCFGRPNAIYGNNCQNNYVICQNGATFPYNCPAGFVFNAARAVCDLPSRMQCGGAPAASAPAYGQPAAAAPAYVSPQAAAPSYSSY